MRRLLMLLPVVALHGRADDARRSGRQRGLLLPYLD